MFSLFQNRHPFTITLMLPMAALLCALFFFFDVPNAVKISLGLWRLPIEFATKGIDYQIVLFSLEDFLYSLRQSSPAQTRKGIKSLLAEHRNLF